MAYFRATGVTPIFQRIYNFKVVPAKYLNVYMHWEEDTTTSSANLWSGLVIEPDTGEYGQMFTCWRYSTNSVDFRLANRANVGWYWFNASVNYPLTNAYNLKMLLTIDMTDISTANCFRAWFNGVEDTSGGLKSTGGTVTAGEPGYPKSYWHGGTPNIIYIPDAANKNITNYDFMYWTSNYPLNQNLVDKITSYEVNPVALPDVYPIAYLDFNQWPLYNHVDGQSAKTVNWAGSIPKIIPHESFNKHGLRSKNVFIPGIRSEDVDPPHVVRVR